MAIFKRGRVYWYHFIFNCEHIQASTKQGNPRTARQMEAAHKTALAKGEVGIRERKPAPTLKDFAQRFIDAIQVRSASKPRTIEFYAQQLARLLDFAPLASARLDSIDESLIESFVQERSRSVSPATVNRALACLRRLLRLAQEWRVIERIPRIRLLAGEGFREFTLTSLQEQAYLAAAPQPLRDFALLLIDTGLRPSEALTLDWADVSFSANGSRCGYIRVRDGKTRNAKRNVPITGRVREMLENRKRVSECGFVFSENRKSPVLLSSLDHVHSKLRRSLQLPDECVLYSLRHTYLTRLGEAGADAFVIMKLAGHSSVTVSQRYVHPTPQSMEKAVERLQALNEAERQLPATVSATLQIEASVTH